MLNKLSVVLIFLNKYDTLLREYKLWTLREQIGILYSEYTHKINSLEIFKHRNKNILS